MHNFSQMRVSCAQCGRPNSLSPESEALAYQQVRGARETPYTADEPCVGCKSMSVVLTFPPGA